MESYDWMSSMSRKSIEQLFNKAHKEIPHAAEYSTAVDKLMNEGMSCTFAICTKLTTLYLFTFRRK